MSDSRADGHLLTPLQREAQAWVTRLVSGAATQADAASLRAWCAQSTAHAVAFSEASQLWRAFGPAGSSLRADQRRAARHAPVSQPPPRRQRIGRRILAGAAVAGAAAVITRPPFGLWPSLADLRSDYRTGIGEQRRLVMSDGTAILMNTRTSISRRAAGASGAGGFELLGGEAVFTLPNGRSRPLTVWAAGVHVSARTASLPATFNVRCHADTACVTCLANPIDVDHADRAVLLEAMQSVTFAAGAFGRTTRADPEVATAWEHGLLVFKMAPLSDVIGELNRYRPGQIILLNRQLGSTPVNGRFRIDQPEQSLKQIERAFGVHGQALPGGFVLLT